MNSENLTIRTDPETKKRWIQLMDFLKEKGYEVKYVVGYSSNSPVELDIDAEAIYF